MTIFFWLEYEQKLLGFTAPFVMDVRESTFHNEEGKLTERYTLFVENMTSGVVDFEYYVGEKDVANAILQNVRRRIGDAARRGDSAVLIDTELLRPQPSKEDAPDEEGTPDSP